MPTVTGSCDGKTVVLDRPVQVSGRVRVTVTFPEPSPPEAEDLASERARWLARAKELAVATGAATARRGLRPSGLPLVLPTEAELKERAAQSGEMIREWAEEPPSDDLATWEELRAGLESNRVTFWDPDADD